MSMECNDWVDWGQSEWDNGWTNNVTQNFNSQTTPKGQGTSNRGGKVNQSASRYFEKNPVEDEWIIQNQTQGVQGQNASYSIEAFNNNNSLGQTENREIAPPDNRQSFQSSQNHNLQDAHNSRPKKVVSGPQVSNKPFTSQRQVLQDNVESSNISSYFTSNQSNKVPPSSNEQFQTHFFTDVSNQNTLSGPASFSGFPVHQQQQLEQDSQYTSLDHQVQSFEQVQPSSLSNQQMEPQHTSSNLSSRQPISQQPHQQTAPPISQPPSGTQQQPFNRLTSHHDSRLQQPPPNVFRQQPQMKDDRSIPKPLGGNQSHRFSPPEQKLRQGPQLGDQYNIPQQHTDNQYQRYSPPQQQVPQNMSGISSSQQQISQNVLTILPSQQQIPQNITSSSPQQQIPSQNIPGIPPPQQHLSQNLSGGPIPHHQVPQNISSGPTSQQMVTQNISGLPQPQHQTLQNIHGMPPPSTMENSYQTFTPQGSTDISNARNLTYNQSSINQSVAQGASNIYPSNASSPPASNTQLPVSSSQTFSSSNSIGNRIPQQEEGESFFPLQDHQPPSFHQTLLEPSKPPPSTKQLNNDVHLQSSGAPSFIQPSSGVHQQSPQMSHPPMQPPVNQAFTASHKSSSGSGREENMTPRLVDNSPRYTPSPQQPLSNTYPPPTTISHPSQALHFEIQDQKTPSQSTNLSQSTFQVSSLNLLPPMATSSPLAGNNRQLPENEERIPENKEYPDNTEEVTHDLKALSVNSPHEAENEAQKHCAIDRNQYLETGQFSAQKENNAYTQNIDVNDEGEAPPPGLHRLVTGQGYEPWKAEPETTSHPTPVGDSVQSQGVTRNSSPLSSIEDDSGREDERKERRREVPGEAEPLQGRVVLGQVPTPPDTVKNRNDRGERDGLERMVVGEQGGQSGGNTSDDYRQGSRTSRHTRIRRNDSSFETEERDYSSDRDRRNDDHRRRDDRPRRRREPRSPEYRSDEEYEERRTYRGARDSRRVRDYSPDRSYYRDYYREEDQRHPRHYYHRDYDDYYRDNQRSRPSSRSGSDYRHSLAKHSMRVLPGNHYYDHPGPGYQDMNMKYSSQREYFERLRQADPAGYAAWYYQYMQGRFMQESARAFSSDRASVHSGQSSSNQRHGVSTPQEAVEDLTREEEEDYTTRLYDCAHIRGNLDGHGRLIVVEPNYPLDHQKATVNICRLSQVSLDKDSEDFFQSPGPFIPGVTHRNTVLQYLKRISDKATKSSEKLLYDLVHMTVKGNGDINGSDVAELLMESYKNSKEEEEDPAEVRSTSITRFRELLQQGNKAEALEWAMENGAWGHALFLASKMGERTHNDIMLRFANSIPHNDPLQTLYQLMSGYVPQAATCCADKKWSDWRPHLAMMLSNPTGNYNLDRQAIITLGDSLNASGRLFASHFCYVTAQVEFSNFRPDAKLVLLGSSHNQDFSMFATCRAIMLTMCYEYGLKLKQPTFNIPSLQIYKLILAARLIDNGRIRNALQYCELLAREILSANTPVQKSLVSSVIDFSSRLKMFDPVLALSGDTEKDPDWLGNLKHFHNALPDDQEVISHNPSPLTTIEPHDDLPQHDLGYTMPDSQASAFSESGPPSTSLSMNSYQMVQQPTPSSSLPPVPTYQPQPLLSSASGTYQPLSQPVPQELPPHSQIDSPEDVYHHQAYSAPSLVQVSNHQHPLAYQSVSDISTSPDNIDLNSGPEPMWESRPPPPVIQSTSSEPTQSQRNSFFKATEEQLKAVDDSKATMKVLNEVGGADKKKDSGKAADGKGGIKTEEQSSGWFGGIWEKIALRPKNQMRLPDDSNPSIIWDEKQKKWVNLDGDSESSSSVKPPPKVSEALPPQGNKYKIQKGKLMKSNYVDVMGNKDKIDSVQRNFVMNPMPQPTKTNYFIPPPVEGNANAPVDFITSGNYNPLTNDTSDNNNKGQLSRSSSVSSLSREVQYYMAPPSTAFPRSKKVPGNVPQMYNPSRYPS